MKHIVRNARSVLALVSLLAVIPVQNASAQEYKKITRLGTSQSVCTGGVSTAAELQDFVAKNPERIRAILTNSGWTGSADDLLAAIAAGNLEETAYPAGTRLAWMGAKDLKTGEFVARPNREWAGKKPFPAFKMNLSSGCQVYHIAIPKACCNVALVSVAPDTSEACLPKPAPVAAPEPKLGLIPYVGAFVATETRARFENDWKKEFHDSSGLVGVRMGLAKELTKRTSIFSQVSFYDRTSVNEGIDFSDEGAAIDFGVDHKLGSSAFIGGGIGAWDLDSDQYRTTSLFAHVGGDIGSTPLQWFLEGRIFDTDATINDSVDDNKMFSIGVRYLVK